MSSQATDPPHASDNCVENSQVGDGASTAVSPRMTRLRHSLLAALFLSACANDVVDNGDVVASYPGDNKADEACEWQREIVDEELGRSRGEHSTLRIDRDGFAHIVYEDHPVDSRNGVQVRYATNRSGQWLTSVVSTTCRLMAGETDYQPLGTRSNSNFDLDADGHAFIVCSNADSVLLLDNARGSWRETEVRTPAQAYAECRANEHVPDEAYSACRYYTHDFGRHVAMRLDSHGTPHIVYSAERDQQYSSHDEWLEYSTKVGTTWVHESIGGNSFYFDVAVDGRDRVHVVKQVDLGAYEGKGLGYTTNVTGAWQTTTLASTRRGSMGLFVSAAVAKSGRLHAVHFDNTGYADHAYTSGLTYLKKGNGPALATELKRANVTEALVPDIALDVDENVHIIYYDQGSLVYQLLKGDQMYPPMTVDQGGVGRHPSLALGGGTIHVTYFDIAESRLKYARWACAQ